MSTSHSTTKNRIDSQEIVDHYINGPYWEPPTIPNATTYWRCDSYNRESVHERDLYQDLFQAADCEVRR